jgi:hypothetical protein
MSQGAGGPEEPTYRDVQRLSPWVSVALIAAFGVAGYFAATLPPPGSHLFAVAAGMIFMIGLIVAVNFSELGTEVTPTAIRGRFGLHRFEIPLERVRRVEVVAIDPWTTENWGVRGPKVKGGFIGLRGRGGVKLSSVDGTDLVLGSNRPEELAEAIRGRLGQASRPPTTT